MSDIKTKSIGILIDELITTSMKCWFAQEDIKNLKDDALVADAARRAQTTNKRRCDLITAIDELIGNQYSLTKKTY